MRLWCQILSMRMGFGILQMIFMRGFLLCLVWCKVWFCLLLLIGLFRPSMLWVWSLQGYFCNNLIGVNLVPSDWVIFGPSMFLSLFRFFVWGYWKIIFRRMIRWLNLLIIYVLVVYYFLVLRRIWFICFWVTFLLGQFGIMLARCFRSTWLLMVLLALH